MFASGLPRIIELARQIIIIRKQARFFVAQRNNHCTGERRQVDNCARLVGALYVGQHVRQHQPPFCVGVQNLNRLTGQAGDNIARALGGCIRHIFDQTHDTNGVDLRLPTRQGTHQTDHSSRTAHIGLHFAHPSGWLNANAASIKGDPLADESHRLGVVSIICTTPVHDHTTAFTD